MVGEYNANTNYGGLYPFLYFLYFLYFLTSLYTFHLKSLLFILHVTNINIQFVNIISSYSQVYI